jgi:hypothetical protein
LSSKFMSILIKGFPSSLLISFSNYIFLSLE